MTRSRTKKTKTIETLTHREDKQRSIPTAACQSVLAKIRSALEASSTSQEVESIT